MTMASVNRIVAHVRLSRRPVDSTDRQKDYHRLGEESPARRSAGSERDLALQFSRFGILTVRRR